MSPETASAYDVVQITRRYREAFENQDPLAVDIDDARTLERRRQGIPQCELRPHRNTPCVVDVQFLTARRGLTNSLRLARQKRLSDFLASPSAAAWAAALPLSHPPTTSAGPPSSSSPTGSCSTPSTDATSRKPNGSTNSCADS